MDSISRWGRKQARLVREAETRAFDSYLRHGRTTEIYTRVISAARDEKALAAFSRSHLSQKAPGETRPTAHYTWRTARDERVRSAHAANEGRVFAWSNPPSTGHPGVAHNCRCWPEPYYGDPTVPDTSLPLKRERRTAASDEQLWASIETLSRPDGTLAESLIQLRDGTRTHSVFSGSTVLHNVRFPDGHRVRAENNEGLQAFYLGDSREPLVQSRWTVNGPVLLHPPPDIDVFDPTPPLPSIDSVVGAAIVLALLKLREIQEVEPESVGAGPADVPVLAMRAWRQQGRPIVGPVSQTSITSDQARAFCRRLPDVQEWTNRAAKAFASERSKLDPRTYGTKVHTWIKHEIDRLRRAGQYLELRAELSLLREAIVDYGRVGSTRLDILEDRRGDTGYICVYDVKTGQSALSLGRLKQISSSVLKHFGPVPFVVLEVKPIP